MVIPIFPEVWAGVSNPTLASIAALLSTPAGAMLGWVHFLAFDLFVARWAYLDSRERRISAWLVSPILVLVLMVGPLGFLLYLGLRTLHAYFRAPQRIHSPSTNV